MAWRPWVNGRTHSRSKNAKLASFSIPERKRAKSLNHRELVPGHAPAHEIPQNNVAALEIKRHLGVCYKTAWLMKHKLMEVMRVREEGRQLDGRVVIDDAYLGGERTGGKVGRGSENKVPFVAAVQTTPDDQPQFMCLRRQPVTCEEMAVFAACSIAPSATVVSGCL